MLRRPWLPRSMPRGVDPGCVKTRPLCRRWAAGTFERPAARREVAWRVLPLRYRRLSRRGTSWWTASTFFRRSPWCTGAAVALGGSSRSARPKGRACLSSRVLSPVRRNPGARDGGPLRPQGALILGAELGWGGCDSGWVLGLVPRCRKVSVAGLDAASVQTDSCVSQYLYWWHLLLKVGCVFAATGLFCAASPLPRLCLGNFEGGGHVWGEGVLQPVPPSASTATAFVLMPLWMRPTASLWLKLPGSPHSSWRSDWRARGASTPPPRPVPACVRHQNVRLEARP